MFYCQYYIFFAFLENQFLLCASVLFADGIAISSDANVKLTFCGAVAVGSSRREKRKGHRYGWSFVFGS